MSGADSQLKAENTTRGEEAPQHRTLVDYVPGLGSLRAPTREQLLRDLFAGLTLSVLLIPQAMAYGQLAGMPLSVGLASAILPAVMYALLGTSVRVAVGPVALVSLIVAEALTRVDAAGDPARAAMLALLVGALLLALGVLRLGFLVNFVSKPVIIGFTTAAGILIIASQLGTLLRVDFERGPLQATLVDLWTRRSDWHLPTLTLGATALAGFVGFRILVPSLLSRLPLGAAIANAARQVGPLVVIAVAMTLAWWQSGSDSGLEMTGALPERVLHFGLPAINLAEISALLPTAAAIAVIVFVLGTGIGQQVSPSNASPGNADQQAIAFGVSNLIASVSGGYAVGVSASRSAMNQSNDVRSPVASLSAAVAVFFAVSLVGGAFEFLPKAVLAALIVSAAWGLIDIAALVRVWRFSPAEALTAFLTLGGVLFFGLEPGIAVGALAGVALYLYGTSRPRIVELGKLDGEAVFRSVEHDQVSQPDPSVLALRLDEALIFANVQHLEQRIQFELARRTGCRFVLLDLSSVDTVDYTAAEGLLRLLKQLKQRKVNTAFVSVHAPVWARLQDHGLTELGSNGGGHFRTHGEALAALENGALQVPEEESA